MKTKNYKNIITELKQQSWNLEKKAFVEKVSNNWLDANMLKGESCGIEVALNELEPSFNCMVSKIKNKNILVSVLFVLLVIAGGIIYNQAREIEILRDYNEVVEQTDYNNFQD